MKQPQISWVPISEEEKGIDMVQKAIDPEFIAKSQDDESFDNAPCDTDCYNLDKFGIRGSRPSTEKE